VLGVGVVGVEKLLEKLSTYNLLNNLLPGAIIYLILKQMIGFVDFDTDIITKLFVYYFVGMVVNRIGSIIVGPICKKLKIVKYANYKDYLEAIKVDSEIGILLETNNIYRTFLSGFILVVVVKLYIILGSGFQFLLHNYLMIIVIALVLLFAFSYRKQTSYIRKRVQKAVKSNSK